jgi:hypothetical protein
MGMQVQNGYAGHDIQRSLAKIVSLGRHVVEMAETVHVFAVIRSAGIKFLAEVQPQ